jgi:hypothetical protein
MFTLSAVAADTRKFSFSVFGDSRLPGNMNFTQDQQGSGGEIDRYIQANFDGKTIADCALRFNKAERTRSIALSPAKKTTPTVGTNSIGAINRG